VNLQFRISGYGKVLSQSIDAGKKIKKGDLCVIKGLNQSGIGKY